MDIPLPIDDSFKPELSSKDVFLFLGLAFIIFIVLQLLASVIISLWGLLFLHYNTYQLASYIKSVSFNGYFITIVTILDYVLMLVVVYLFLYIREQSIEEALSIKFLSEYRFKLLILLSLFLVALGIVASNIDKDQVMKSPMYAIFSNGKGLWLLFSCTILVAPAVEEVIYRGFIFGPLEKAWGENKTIVLVTVLFTLPHIFQLWGAWFSLIPIAGLGLVTSKMRAITKSIIPGWIVHTIYNFILISITLVAILFQVDK